MEKQIHKINMVELANLLLDDFYFIFSEGKLELYDGHKSYVYDDYESLIHEFASQNLLAQYILSEEDLDQIEEDVQLYMIRELSNRLHNHLASLDTEDKAQLKHAHKAYFIYNEDEL